MLSLREGGMGMHPNEVLGENRRVQFGHSSWAQEVPATSIVEGRWAPPQRV